MHQYGAGRDRLFGIEHEGQLLVNDAHFLRRVLGERAAVGNDRGDPFAGVARNVRCQRPARHIRRFEPVHQRQRGGGEFVAVEHVMHAGHGQRRALVDALDARRRVGAGDQRDVAHVRQLDIGDEVPLAGDKTAVLAHAAVGRDVAVGLAGHGASFGRLTPRMRSAARAIASTICA